MKGPPVFGRADDTAVAHDAAVGRVGAVDKRFEERLERQIKDKFRFKI